MLKEIEFFAQLYITENFTKAAEKCNISQSGFSQAIKKLEDYLGKPLVERGSKRKVIFTKHGREFYPLALEISQKMRKLHSLRTTWKSKSFALIELGIIPTISPYILPRLLQEINSSKIKVSVSVHENKTLDLLEKLRTGMLDAAVLAEEVDDDNLESSLLYEDELLFAAMKHGKFSYGPDHVNIKDLFATHTEMILLEEGHCLRDQVGELCSKYLRENKEFSATSLETVKELVKHNLGYSIIPKIAVQEHDIKYLVFKHFRPKYTRKIYLVWRKATDNIQYIKQVKEILKGCLEEAGSVQAVSIF